MLIRLFFSYYHFQLKYLESHRTLQIIRKHLHHMPISVINQWSPANTMRVCVDGNGVNMLNLTHIWRGERDMFCKVNTHDWLIIVTVATEFTVCDCAQPPGYMYL